jgi:prophage DNA circulation protein
LSSVSRQLPRVVQFEFNDFFPSLALANRIYQDASRYEEIAAENETINPLFVQRLIKGLSV